MKKGLIYFILVFAIITISCNRKIPSVTIIDIHFKNDTTNVNDSVKTINSLTSVGDLLIFNYTGSYVEVLQNENQILKNKAQIACSIFSVSNDSVNLMGRNMDLQFDLKNILVGRYNPPNAYKSISITAFDFLVGNKKIDPDSLSVFIKSRLLKAPFYLMDGINEQGLSVGIASVPSQKIGAENNKEKIDILLLNRLILDNAKNVNEAIELAKKYDVFDADINTISHHYIISDSGGNSVIIEYQNGEMQFLRNDKNYQIITNSLVKDKSIAERNIHNRYLKIDKTLISKDDLSVYDAMELLKKVSWQKKEERGGTQWSVVYDLKRRLGLISVKGNFNNAYQFTLN